jgi:uncharacterized protein
MRFALAVLLALCVAAVAVAAEVPYLSGRVVDDAEILKPATRDALAAKLKAHEARTTDQIVVLTVRTIGDASIESFATAVFEQWKLGQKGKDNGVLLIVVPADHKMRIEVGYGLEGTLTDAQAGRIIRNVITPEFKAGDFDGGVSAGVDAMLGVLEGTADLPADDAASASTSSAKFFNQADLPPWPVRILLGAFVFGIIGLFTVVGVMTPGMGWFLYFFLVPFWAMFPIIVVGVRGALVMLGTYVVAFPIAKLIVSRQPWYAKASVDLKRKGTTSIGGWTMSTSGGGGSWSSGGGGGGGGGFSGGGGSSGGGGASGSW